jgi:DNA-directed RNA polymerase subunit alpha
MEKIPLPVKINFEKTIKPNQALVTVEPFYPGYGTTIGNSLRRIMLSSLPGGAITAVKIKGVPHEFSAIPYILEDAVQIILNLKLVRLKIFTDEPIKLTLSVKGEKKITAKDIKTSSDAEIVNSEQHLATLTHKNAELNLELYARQSRGFWPVEERAEEQEVGVIAIDAVFTPVRKVGLRIENVRVAQVTNYEKIIFDIETDGTISPERALLNSVQILMEQLSFFVENIKIEEEKEKEIKPKKKAEKKTKTPSTKTLKTKKKVKK